MLKLNDIDKIINFNLKLKNLNCNIHFKHKFYWITFDNYEMTFDFETLKFSFQTDFETEFQIDNFIKNIDLDLFVSFIRTFIDNTNIKYFRIDNYETSIFNTLIEILIQNKKFLEIFNDFNIIEEEYNRKNKWKIFIKKERI